LSRAIVSALLVALVLGVFLQVRHHEFVDYDDPIYVVDNPNLRDGITAASVWRAFREPYETNWIPLVWLSLTVDYGLYGLEPAGYLLTNVALHALSAVLLFLFLMRTTGALGASAFVAAVFAVHPLHVESVAWVSERKDALAGVFWMLAMLAYAAWVARRGALRYAALVLALAAGLLAKPMLVTLPFALLLLDYWPLGRLGRGPVPEARLVRRAVLEKLPLFALVAVVSTVTFLVQRELGAMQHGDALPLHERIANALISYVLYLRDAVWPRGLAVFYPHLQSRTPLGLAAACAALLLAISVAIWRSRRPYLVMGWLWYLGNLVPVLGLVQVGMQSRADRYMYVPLIGLSIAAAWGALELAGTSRLRRRVAAGLGALGVAALSVTAWLQVGHWRDTESLYRHATLVTRDNFLAHHGLGGLLLRQGAIDEAAAHFREALRIKPRWPGAHFGVGDVHLARGEFEAAILAYERGLRYAPRNGRGNLQLTRALLSADRNSEAIGRARTAARLTGGRQRAELLGLLGVALARKGRMEEALAELDRALAIWPEYAEGHANRGLALLALGRGDEAQAAIDRALDLGHESPALYSALGDLNLARGASAEAVDHYRAALALAPDDLHAANNLAWTLATTDDPALRDPDEALRVAGAAAEATEGGDPGILDTLAAAYAAAGRYDEAAATARRAAELADRQGRPAFASELRARGLEYTRDGAR
jgi:tetratricopeptide (TPR) repeat protein